MLRFQRYNIVFQEVPGEVTLAINLSNCPNRCKGCHSPYLQEDKGDMLDENVLDKLLEKYGDAVTCICFMGGDAEPMEVERLVRYVKAASAEKLKTAWYSGKTNFPESCSINHFNYLKLGPYVEALGGLEASDTNQRFYRIEEEVMQDETYLFRSKKDKTAVWG